MKSTNTKKLPVIIALACAAVVIALICIVGAIVSQKGYDTVKDSQSGKTSSQKQESSASSGEDFAAVKILSDQSGKDFDPVLYTKRLYELKYQFGADGFGSVSELSISAVVQFAFCHIYYDSLTDMPDGKTMLFRQVLPESISDEIYSLFGENSVDVKKSDLYNKKNGLIEMWQPKLGTEVYANAVCEKAGDGRYKVTATFFKEADKTKKDSVVTGVFQKQDDGYIIVSMETE